MAEPSEQMRDDIDQLKLSQKPQKMAGHREQMLNETVQKQLSRLRHKMAVPKKSRWTMITSSITSATAETENGCTKTKEER